MIAGTVWTASAHIITAVIGSGVLSLAWATAQLGWVAGPTVMLLFSFVTYYTSSLLSACYRSGDPLTGKRNYTYMDAVRSNLGQSSFDLFVVPLREMGLPSKVLKFDGFFGFGFFFFSGGLQVKICGIVQYLNLFGVAIGYTIASSISMM